MALKNAIALRTQHANSAAAPKAYSSFPHLASSFLQRGPSLSRAQQNDVQVSIPRRPPPLAVAHVRPLRWRLQIPAQPTLALARPVALPLEVLAFALAPPQWPLQRQPQPQP